MSVPRAGRTQKRSLVTRRKLFDAAEQVFGALGFHATAISEITRTAGVAQGTFYLHFESKELLFSALVADISMRLRRHLAAAVAGSANRLIAERRGLEAFCAFVQQHPGMYRIVQESQFVDPAAYRDYYERLAASYRQVLGKAAQRGDIISGDTDAQAWALMGIGHFLGMRHCLWAGEVPSAATLDAVLDLITHGLAPRLPGTTS
jgi:AcrR family transcriptional regulator